MKSHESKIMLAIKDYFNNSTLHGLKFISENDRHWSERLFWIIVCCASWCGSGLLILASWDAFQTNSISFVVETTYLNAKTSFPAISFCELNNMIRVYDMAQNLYGKDHDCNLDEVLKEISYFHGTAYYIKEFCFTGDLKCPETNLKELAETIRSPCEYIFIECSWKGKTFNCCDHFHVTNTEMGQCYTLSNKYEKPDSDDYIYMYSNMNIGLASLRLVLNATGQLYMHSEADTPFYNTMTTDILPASLNSHKTYTISVKDIENEPEVKQLSVNQRACRFPDENYLTVANEYSYSACVVECRKEAQLKLCNCTSHFMPKTEEDERCDVLGIYCLNQNYGNLSVQKTSWSHKEGLICNCLPGCNEPEYDLITSTEMNSDTNTSIIDLLLHRLPSERYKRNVVRGRLDLVVSMGGAAGLFVGASLLSFIELFYYFSLRLHRKCSKKIENEQNEIGENEKTEKKDFTNFSFFM